MSKATHCIHGENIGNACPVCEWQAGRSFAATHGSNAAMCAEIARLQDVLRSAAECIESNKRHLESTGRHATIGTGQVLDEIANALRSPNDKVSDSADREQRA